MTAADLPDFAFNTYPQGQEVCNLEGVAAGTYETGWIYCGDALSLVLFFSSSSATGSGNSVTFEFGTSSSGGGSLGGASFTQKGGDQASTIAVPVYGPYVRVILILSGSPTEGGASVNKSGQPAAKPVNLVGGLLVSAPDNTFTAGQNVIQFPFIWMGEVQVNWGFPSGVGAVQIIDSFTGDSLFDSRGIGHTAGTSDQIGSGRALLGYNLCHVLLSMNATTPGYLNVMAV